MNFYFNMDENVCADEKWVAEKLHIDYPELTVEEHIEGLRTEREYCGWYECTVSDTIWDAMYLTD